MQIACIGNAVYDFTVSANDFVVEGVRNSFDNATYSAGGPASNAASVISKFGREVDFYGRIGNDETGKYVYNKMALENIDLKHLIVSKDIMTPFSFVILNTSKSTRTIFTVRAKSDYKNAKIGINSYGTNYDYILTDGKYVEDTINLIKANPKAKTIIDAGRVNDGILKLCNMIDYIICSEDFANAVTGCEINNDYQNNVMVFQKMKSLFKNATGIAITIGKRGYICEKDGIVLIKPSYVSGLPVVDTNCAGDIFHGAFTYAISSGYDYYQALEFANITSSLSVSKIGGRDSCPELFEVENALKNNYRKVLSKTISKIY